MNNNRYIFKNNIILKSLVFLLFIGNVNSLILEPTQSEAARSLFMPCYSNRPSYYFDDVCYYLSSQVNCIPDELNKYLVIDKISLYNAYVCELGDISAFKNLTEFSNIFSSNSVITSEFLSSITSLSNLKTLTIQNVLSFPKSNFTLKYNSKLEKVSINTNAPVPAALFASNITYLEIVSSNYIQGKLKTFNYALKSLLLDINIDALVQSDLGLYLPNVDYLKLHFKYGTSGIGALNLELGLFNSLSKLDLNIDKFYKIPSSFLANGNYKEMNLEGEFNFENGFDFSNNLYPLQFSSSYASFKCPNSPCYKFPNGSSISMYSTDIPLSDIDFKNVIKFSFESSSYSGLTLPLISDDRYDLDLKVINNYYLRGDIPNNYCQLKSVNLKDNNLDLNGKVPNCFKCSSYTMAMISYGTLNSYDCPNFSIDNPDQLYIASSTFNGYITINGTDIGWNYENMLDGKMYSMSIPNKRVQIVIPSGVGKENKTIQVKFHNDKLITFSYIFPPPLIASYDIYSDQGNKYLQLYGDNFEIETTAPVLISNIDSSIDFLSNYNAKILYSNDQNLLSSLKEGQKYQVSVTVGDQKSNLFEFYYFENLSINNDNILRLNPLGGQVILNSSFSSLPDISITKCFINSKNCEISKITNNSITIKYPPSPSIVTTLLYNSTEIKINIGGRILYLYTEYDITPSSSTSSSSSSSSNTSDSFNDFVSFSTSKFNYFNFITLVIFIISITI